MHSAIIPKLGVKDPNSPLDSDEKILDSLLVPYHLPSRVALRLNASTFPPTSDETEQFSAANVQVFYEETLDSGYAQELISSVDALLVISAKVHRATINVLSKCRVIARYGSGTDNIDVEGATEAGIIVTNVPDFCLSEVADHTMALLLGSIRKLRLMDQHARDGHWQARVQESVPRIAGKTLGLVGFGKTAQQVARRAEPFGLNIVAHDPFLDHACAESLHVREVGFEELLTRSDFISLHAPLTAGTRHMIGEQQLRKMKHNAILVNTSRGALVDEPALVRALSERWIAGAGIDVYETLPMFDLHPEELNHPLFQLDNVILTPHSAGCSTESLQQLMSEGAGEAIAVLSGKRPSHWVNPSVTPRIPFNDMEGSTGD